MTDDETRAEPAARTNPRPVYGPGAPDSFFRDMFIAATGQYGAYDPWQVDEARARLRQQDMRNDSALAERAATYEKRAGMTSGTTSGGSFVTPEYLVEDFALYLSPLSAFAYQCTPIEDPGVGLTMYIPQFTAAVGVAQQLSENQGLPGATGASTLLSANLTTQGGRQPVSQQLIDRAGPFAIDKVIGAQIGDEVRYKVDNYVVTQAITNGQTFAGASTPLSNAKLWGDIQGAGDQMAESAGQNLRPTHFFAVPKQVQFFLAQVDGNARPLMTPTPEGMWLPDRNDPSGQPAAGATGYNINGLAVYHDGNIPASGANAQLLVARPSEFFVQVSKPYFRVIIGAQGQAQNLTADLEGWVYCGVIARRASACQVITGSAYPSTVVFA